MGVNTPARKSALVRGLVGVAVPVRGHGELLADLRGLGERWFLRGHRGHLGFTDLLEVGLHLLGQPNEVPVQLVSAGPVLRAVAASSTTLAVSHLLAAVGPARACSRSASVAGRMSATVRTTGVQSWTAPTSATRFRLPCSPLDSRPASFGVALSAALAVAGRSASGRIAMPFPSTCTTSTSESSAVGGGLWQA